MTWAIRVQGLHKSFGSLQAVQDLSLEVEAGSVCALLGPNGAGKTTTLRMLLGLLKPDKGTAQALALDCWSQSLELRHRVGYLSADMRFYPWLTAPKALAFASEVRGRDVTARGLELAERLGLAVDLPAGRMSRGNLQKLGLVLALAPQPELLLFDEPSSGLDPLIQETFLELVSEARAQGTTVFLSSHTFSEVDRLAQQVVVIKQGKAVVSETLESFRARAGRRVILLFGETVPEDGPAQLQIAQRQERRWEGVWSGPTAELIGWCAEHSVEDLELSSPLLDNAFLDFYR